MPKKLIDPIYKKYASRVVSAIASTEFYDYFMEVLSAGQNNYQFSNRHVEKSVDERWVIAVENTLQPMEEIINNPRNFIMTEEAIVNVALAKKVTPDTIRHLAQHGDMIDSVTETSVKPNRLMEKFKEDSWNTYENRFVYTLLEMAWDFVDKRYDAIFQALGDECGSHLIMNCDARSLNEHIKASIDMRIQEEEDLLAADERSESIFARISRCHRILSTFRTTGFAKTMAKYGKIKPPLFPTNAIKKNPNFKACHKLWNFILSYNDIGYKIDIFEQSNEITEDFETDIKNSIMFDYIILKNYLQMKEDRVIDTTRAFKKKAIKPTYIKEVIEEIVKNYDLPDVEVKKVLVEEIDKAQLLKLEENERLRLVAEKEKEMKARRLKEEKEQRKKEREEAREKARQEKERLKEIERQERQKEAEVKRAERQEEKRLEEEGLWLDKLKGELGRFDEALDYKRNRSSIELAAQKKKEKEQQLKEAEREKKRAVLEKQKAKEKAQKEAEKAKEKARAEKEKEKAKAKKTAAKPAEPEKTEPVKEEEKKQAATEKPAAEKKPAKTSEKKPAETKKTEKPAEAKKAEAKKEPAKKAAEKPVKETKPAEEKKTAKAEKPAKETKAAKAEKPAEEKKAAKAEKPVKETKPAEAEKPATETKPAEAEKPVKETKPAEAEKPAEETKPAETVPAEEAKPAEEKIPDRPLPGAPISQTPHLTPSDLSTFGEKKPLGVTELEDEGEKKGIKGIFKKLFR